MNTRTERLRKRLVDTDPRICPERCIYFTESMKETEGKPNALRRSQAFYDVLSRMTVYVNADELIVGNQAQWPKASPIYRSTPRTGWKQVKWFTFFPDKRPGDKFTTHREQRQNIGDVLEYWKGKSLYENLKDP